MQRDWQNPAAALWLSPMVAALPLAAIMGAPWSPYFIGALMGGSAHPFNRPRLGPVISFLSVFFDAEVLGILAVLFLVAPAYAGLREYKKDGVASILIVCALAGIAASQVARMIASGFPQPGMRDFASSVASPVLGCLCGVTAGAFLAYFARRRMARTLICLIPVAALGIAAVLQIWLLHVVRGS